jgi:sugar (pentulose or hexulose) kinase
MRPTQVILIFDVGKTNKKILLFDEQYKLVYEESVHLDETRDEDDFPCEDIAVLTTWIESSFDKILSDTRFEVLAVNFSAYGASFVFVDEYLNPVLPLYNYLKPYPQNLQHEFYDTYGSTSEFSKRTASPVLGNLNSGMQLYRIKKEKPELFSKIKYALHLPQYLSTILTKRTYSELTSIGCHTNLWDFSSNDYHEWVYKEGMRSILPPVLRGDECLNIQCKNKTVCIGIGLHDSSAALIPYLANFKEPFILLSTGTWCISLNPFNHTALTIPELDKDCLCYLTYQGTPVKASRLFSGYEHEQQSKRISEFYDLPIEYFTKLAYDPRKIKPVVPALDKEELDEIKEYPFANRNLNEFDANEAYHQLIMDIVNRQFHSTQLVQQGNKVKRIFVDGGFSKNSIFMNLLAIVFPDVEVYAASVAQASAMGAALAVHKHWNKKAIPSDLIELRFFHHAIGDSAKK